MTAAFIASVARDALLAEACATPKPGLVDREGSVKERFASTVTPEKIEEKLKEYFA